MAFPGWCPDMARRSLPTLAKWAVLLGGPLIWSAHLGFVYAVATVAITLTGEAGLVSRVLIGLATLVCLAAPAWIGWSLWAGRLPRWETPPRDLIGLWRQAGPLLCLLSFLAVLWHALPAHLIPSQPATHAALLGANAPPEPPFRR